MKSLMYYITLFSICSSCFFNHKDTETTSKDTETTSKTRKDGLCVPEKDGDTKAQIQKREDEIRKCPTLEKMLKRSSWNSSMLNMVRDFDEDVNFESLKDLSEQDINFLGDISEYIDVNALAKKLGSKGMSTFCKVFSGNLSGVLKNNSECSKNFIQNFCSIEQIEALGSLLIDNAINSFSLGSDIVELILKHSRSSISARRIRLLRSIIKIVHIDERTPECIEYAEKNIENLFARDYADSELETLNTIKSCLIMNIVLAQTDKVFDIGRLQLLEEGLEKISESDRFVHTESALETRHYSKREFEKELFKHLSKVDPRVDMAKLGMVARVQDLVESKSPRFKLIAQHILSIFKMSMGDIEWLLGVNGFYKLTRESWYILESKLTAYVDVKNRNKRLAELKKFLEKCHLKRSKGEQSQASSSGKFEEEVEKFLEGKYIMLPDDEDDDENDSQKDTSNSFTNRGRNLQVNIITK